MRTSTETYAIDANVILRFLLMDNPELSPKACDVMVAAREGKLTLFCDPVILAEVVWVLTSYYELSRQEISDVLVPLLKYDHFTVPDKSRYLQALELYGSTNAHFADACACAAALEDCEGRLLSFDRKLSLVEGISRSESL